MTIADALAIYAEEHAPTVAAPERLAYAMQALLPFWGALPVSAVKKATCGRYAAQRKRPILGPAKKNGTKPIVGWKPISPGTIRRELNCLGAALAYCHGEGYLLTAPKVALPEKPETKQRAMTRSEAAKFIRTARARGQHHIARFVLIALYTGTRKEAILNLRLGSPSTVGGWIDLEAGVIYRRGSGERATKKRRTPAKLPRQILAHARRWKATGSTWAVEWRGSRVSDIKTAWGKIAADADLGWHPTPHTLKHTAITWAIQRGASITDAAGFFATSTETIERVYWHHSPHFQEGAVRAMEAKR